MSFNTHSAESLYSRLLTSSASHVDLCVHALVHQDHYQSYPMPVFGSALQCVLPQLKTRFVIQASNARIMAAINEAPWPQSEVHLGYGCTVQIFDNASELTRASDYMQSAAFIRTDYALVMWGDYEDAIALYWDEIISHIQTRYGTVAQDSVPFAGLSANEFSSLVTIPSSGPLPSSSSVASQPYAGLSHYPQWPLVQSESPDLGGLQLAFNVTSVPSPSSDNSISSFGDFPFTFDFPGHSLSPGYLIGGPNEGEDVASDVSVVSSTQSDRGRSPAPSVSSSEGTTSTTIDNVAPPSAIAPSTFRRHSVGQTAAPLGRTDSEKTVTKRAMSEDVNVDGDVFNMNINQHQDVAMAGIRPSKRIRPFTAATSAPALLTVPLPSVDPAHNDTPNNASLKHEENSSFPATRHPTPAPAPAPTSTTTPAPTMSPAPAPAAPRRNRRRGGGTTRAKRTQCEYCSKTFSRMQDAQRHVAASCAASPDKMGISCPECGSVLSRMDAAQRHWRGHENPTCEPPEWAPRA